MSDYDNSGNVQMSTGSLLIGLVLGIILPPIGWLIAFLMHKNYVKNSDFSRAKGIKIGTLISAVGSLVLGLIAAGLFAAIFVPNMNRARAQGQLTACKANQKNIGTALEMWASDHRGKYPKQLSDLTTGERGGYLRQIPTCPAAEEDTYSASYKRSADGKKFEICCSGENHKIMDVPPNKPAFNSEIGIIEK